MTTDPETKRQTQGALAKLVTGVDQQQVTSAGAGKLGELLDRWLDYITPHRAAYTIDEYRRLTNKAIKPALGNVRQDRLNVRLGPTATTSSPGSSPM